MNLKLYGGRVPLRSGSPDHPITLVDFPSQELFRSLYTNKVRSENLDRYWEILCARARGQSMADTARAHGVSKERVRQIEAKFLRLMQQHHSKTKPA